MNAQLVARTGNCGPGENRSISARHRWLDCRAGLMETRQGGDIAGWDIGSAVFLLSSVVHAISSKGHPGFPGDWREAVWAGRRTPSVK